MIPEIGHFALLLAFAVALLQGAILFLAVQSGDASLARVGKHAAYVLAGLIAGAFIILMHAYAISDFSVSNVYENSHSAKPFIYKLTGTWGNHEGSMLLWVLILALYGAGLAKQSRSIPADLHWLTLGVQSLILSAFLAFIIFTSNPFLRLEPAPIDGAGLNPLLQDIGLAIHPPFLYLGYVGFSIPFSFAVAALIRGKADTVWARLVRPWALAAWTFLTIGIMLGSWWAYYELGWGGWWAWDPVENASFMPWLAGTALIHSIRVVERRDAMKSWAVLLGILTFSLSLIGTFLVRSGILTSVHAFAVDPTRGVFILMILFAVIGGSLALYALKAGALKPTGSFRPLSRETALIINNILLLIACATVFFGTFYPLFVDILTGERISVGAPYFNIVFVPMALLLFFVAAAGGLLPWKRAEFNTLLHRLKPAAAAALAGAVIVMLFVDSNKLIGALSIGLAIWLVVGAFSELSARVGVQNNTFKSSWRRMRGLPRSAWGANFAHVGLGIFALGVAGVSLWKTEEIVLMNEGDQISIAGYNVKLVSVINAPGKNYQAERALFEATKSGDTVLLSGERRFYPIRQMQTTEAAIAPRLFGDLYISFGENANGAGWPVRAYFNPLVFLLWTGAMIAASGGALSMSDRGRNPSRVRRQANPSVSSQQNEALA